MKKTKSAKTISLVILMLTLMLAIPSGLSFNGLEHAYASQKDQSSQTPSETIYAAVPLYYTGQVNWAEDLYFDFNNTVGIPLNTSQPAFDQHFLNADYSLVVGTSWNEWFMMLVVSYDAVSVDLAENRTDEICSQFQQAFNLNLSVTDSWHQVDNATHYVTVYRRLGIIHIQHTVQDVGIFDELVKYKPSNGFGQLISTNFLNSLLSSQGAIYVFTLQYTLKRVDAKTFSWRFLLGLEPSNGSVSGDEASVSVNFDKMLNYSGPIVSSTVGMSKIQVEIEKTWAFSVGTYSVALKSISPAYTSRQDDDNILVTYDLTNRSIDNVVASVAIVKVSSGFNSTEWTYAAIVTVLVVLAVSGLVYVRRRRNLRKPDGSEKTIGQEVR
jgi:hypothetical protein